MCFWTAVWKYYYNIALSDIYVIFYSVYFLAIYIFYCGYILAIYIFYCVYIVCGMLQL